MKNINRLASVQQNVAGKQQKQKVMVLDEGMDSYISAVSLILRRGKSEDLKWLCEHRKGEKKALREMSALHLQGPIAISPYGEVLSGIELDAISGHSPSENWEGLERQHTERKFET